jgi:hypothetical protein
MGKKQAQSNLPVFVSSCDLRISGWHLVYARRGKRGVLRYRRVMGSGRSGDVLGLSSRGTVGATWHTSTLKDAPHQHLAEVSARCSWTTIRRLHEGQRAVAASAPSNRVRPSARTSENVWLMPSYSTGACHGCANCGTRAFFAQRARPRLNVSTTVALRGPVSA